jgi:hypothetical protein
MVRLGKFFRPLVRPIERAVGAVAAVASSAVGAVVEVASDAVGAVAEVASDAVGIGARELARAGNQAGDVLGDVPVVGGLVKPAVHVVTAVAVAPAQVAARVMRYVFVAPAPINVSVELMSRAQLPDTLEDAVVTASTVDVDITFDGAAGGAEPGAEVVAATTAILAHDGLAAALGRNEDAARLLARSMAADKHSERTDTRIVVEVANHEASVVSTHLVCTRATPTTVHVCAVARTATVALPVAVQSLTAPEVARVLAHLYAALGEEQEAAAPGGAAAAQ